MPWLCMGDFNEITSQSEKVGATSRHYKQMESFREAIEFFSFSVLITKGLMFTWSDNRRGNGFTKERIDRVMANSNWKHLFTNAFCYVLPALKSDHSPLHINMASSTISSKRKQFIFRYEVAWAVREDCSNNIKKRETKFQEGMMLPQPLAISLSIVKCL